jgi:NAD(P)-dependent dehydrogenase (short-subunit alcohol dehydrogenase family)
MREAKVSEAKVSEAKVSGARVATGDRGAADHAQRLRGLATLVTGGSRGLGRALGEALAQAGARVVLVARDRAALDPVVAAIRARGGQAHGVVADVAAQDSAFAIAGQAAALVGPVDLLINNASTLGPTPLRLLLDTDCEDLVRALAVNLVGPFRLTKAVAGSMVLRGRGTIVNISSDAAVEAYERWGAYGASKAALDHLTRIWAAELAGTGVRVLSVDPGEMNTRMHADAVPDADRASLADPDRVAARIVALLEAREAPASTVRWVVRAGDPEGSAPGTVRS